MIDRFTGAILVGLFAAGSASAQTAAPSAEKQETSCTTSPGATTGTARPAATNSTNSMAVEKSAILPSAGGHAASAAPTVQSDGKPMQVRPDCPSDSQAK